MPTLTSASGLPRKKEVDTKAIWCANCVIEVNMTQATITPATLLRRAAENITAETWCQHGMWRNDGACSAAGHVGVALGFGKGRMDEAATDPTWLSVIAKFRMAVGAPADDEWAFPAWNDTPGRTHAEVKALVLRVADELEAQDA
jgi:hypothetical protein